jgi:hypothetical protein
VRIKRKRVEVENEKESPSRGYPEEEFETYFTNHKMNDHSARDSFKGMADMDDLEGHGRKDEGAKEAWPAGEDSIEVAKKPQEFNVNYNSANPTGTPTAQDMEERGRHERNLKELKKVEIRNTTDQRVNVFDSKKRILIKRKL